MDQMRDDHMLIEITPPLAGQSYGLGGKDIERLILSARWQGVSLFPVTEWPSAVYVSRILDETVTKTHAFTQDQVEVIAWGTIFLTLAEANAHASKFS
jgi:hypothetical protein